MILSSGKVVGNVGEQWKEVRDNRVKNGARQGETQGATGKEIVPVDQGVVQQLSVENVVSQQVQITNKFAVLEVEDDEQENNNELALVAQSTVPRSPNPNATGKGTARSATKPISPRKILNAAAPAYNPTSTGIGAKKVVDLEANVQKDKVTESTTQWVTRAFGINNVTTNQSCQKIPS